MNPKLRLLAKMNKKNDKRLCWNCDGGVSHHISKCPFCGVDVKKPLPSDNKSSFDGFASPFQKAPDTTTTPNPPYTSQQEIVNEEKTHLLEEKTQIQTAKKEIISLILLLPGIIFFLFSLTLLIFSRDGFLSLSWNQNVAYFYFSGSIPLIYLGWKALKTD